MILQALYELAQAEGLSEDLDFQDLPVAWHIALKPDGTLLGIQPRWELAVPEGKKKAIRVVPVERIPMRFGRTSGVASQFLVDNAQYVFGAAPPDKGGKATRLTQCRDAFRASVESCVKSVDTPSIQAVLRFLNDLAEGRQSVTWGADWEANDLFSFVVYPDLDIPVHLMPAAMEYWRTQRAEGPNQAENAPRCVVTGQPVPEPVLFPLIKRVPEGTPSGVGLVTFNFPAVESQGWKGNENAPVSRDAAESCATALNRLLHPAFPDPKEPGNTLPERRYRLTSDTVVLFWAPRAATPELIDGFAQLLNVEQSPEIAEVLEERDDAPNSEARTRQVPAAVIENFRRIWKGIPPDLDDETPFYLLTITGQQGRAIVRDWNETTVKKAFENVARFFGQLGIARNGPSAKGQEHPLSFPIPVLEKALAVRGDTGRLPKALASELFLCAVMGYKFPKQILLRALDRARSESGRDEWMDKQYKDARAALIKAYLIRNEHMEIDPEMNTDELNTGYLLGRLLALLEKIQEEALGNINATLVDRYFKRASTNPGQVFPRLLRTSMSHQRKILRKWPKHGKERKSQVDQILTSFRIDLHDTSDFRIPSIDWSEITQKLPGSLQPEEQGLFLLGYHQQRHALAWRPQHLSDEDVGEAVI